MDRWEKPDEVMATIQEAIARKKSSKVGSMTATEINSTPTEVTEPAPTTQMTNNEISFVLKASPAAPEKQAASVLSTQNRIEQKYKFAKITPYSYSPEDFFFTDSYSIRFCVERTEAACFSGAAGDALSTKKEFKGRLYDNSRN